MENTEFLRVEGVSKSFSGVRVLEDINISFNKGNVHALLGENGAGKSTFMNILFGYYQADGGKIFIEDKATKIASPIDAQKKYIAMIHQENSLIPYLSVMYNIYIGHYPKKGGLIDKHKLYQNTKTLLDELQVDIDPNTPIDSLSVAQKQLIEIVKALSLHPRLILMDEPTASLTEKEAGTLMHIIDKLKKDGVAILYVSHRMEEVFKIADEITVLRDGKLIKTAKRGEIDVDDAVKLMVGRDLSSQMEMIAQLGNKTLNNEIILEVENLSKKGKFENVSFIAHKGEILGFGGLVGAGRSELMEALFGYIPADRGKIFIHGKEVCIKKPYQALENKISLVPEERKEKGILAIMSVKDNINIANYKNCKKGGLLRSKLENNLAEKYVESLSIKTNSIRKSIGNLSGGNQQKVILARWLSTEPEILILDEPTHGIDVGAKADIYKIIKDLSAKGITILLISSDMPELLLLSDRIIVMGRGKINGEIDRKEATEESIMRCAIN